MKKMNIYILVYLGKIIQTELKIRIADGKAP